MGSKASTPHLSLLQCVEFLGVKVGFEGRAFKVLELNFETLVQDKSIVYRLQFHIWMEMQIGLRLLCAAQDLVSDLNPMFGPAECTPMYCAKPFEAVMLGHQHILFIRDPFDLCPTSRSKAAQTSDESVPA